ncbi:hypothetical protein [Mycobacteroides chelonae]|uniref:hypothetical protein n=1 Tax=Mycobacteroides chelonae TaxID=1774 RepID=UPI001041F596|nr:hypothetical protein [Mycobacteroides chelonae]
MTRTALGLPPLPCKINPDPWDSCDNTTAQRMCRQVCRNRFSCALEALKEPDQTYRLEGVVAGVVIPPDNEYGTSKARRHALKQLAAIAAFGNPQFQMKLTKAAAARIRKTADAAAEIAAPATYPSQPKKAPVPSRVAYIPVRITPGVQWYAKNWTSWDCHVTPHLKDVDQCGVCGERTWRGRNFCSSRCEATWSINHDWMAARATMINRHGRTCPDCRTERIVVHRGNLDSGPLSRFTRGCNQHLENLGMHCPTCEGQYVAPSQHSAENQYATGMDQAIELPAAS